MNTPSIALYAVIALGAIVFTKEVPEVFSRTDDLQDCPETRQSLQNAKVVRTLLLEAATLGFDRRSRWLEGGIGVCPFRMPRDFGYRTSDAPAWAQRAGSFDAAVVLSHLLPPTIPPQSPRDRVCFRGNCLIGCRNVMGNR